MFLNALCASYESLPRRRQSSSGKQHGPRDRSLITSQRGGGGGRGRGFGGGRGTILKQAPFWEIIFSLVRNMRGAKFYHTATGA